MTILDTNVLLYAANTGDPNHLKTKSWLDGLIANGSWIGLPWVTLWGFLRISTNHRAFPNPKTPDEAFKVVRTLLDLPGAVVVQPGSRHESLLKDLVSRTNAVGPLLTDAVLAALALEQGATLASTDHDFARFPNLSWVNPLTA